jgi:hypothetical protein
MWGQKVYGSLFRKAELPGVTLLLSCVGVRLFCAPNKNKKEEKNNENNNNK